MGYFVLSPVIGTGLQPEYVFGQRAVLDPRRPKVGEYGNFACIMNDTDGFALSWSVADPAIIDADIECIRIPDNRLDAGTINKNQADNINAKLNAAFGTPPLVSGGMTIREAINAVGGYLQPGWVYTEMSVV